MPVKWSFTILRERSTNLKLIELKEKLFPRAGCWSEEESDESLGNEIEKEWIP